jgi:hypothetical protein
MSPPRELHRNHLKAGEKGGRGPVARREGALPLALELRLERSAPPQIEGREPVVGRGCRRSDQGGVRESWRGGEGRG